MKESSLSLSTVCSEGVSAGRLLWDEFLSCAEKATIPLYKGTQNLIPIKNIRGVRHINTLQIHPIYKQGLTFQTASAQKHVAPPGWDGQWDNTFCQVKRQSVAFLGRINLSLRPPVFGTSAVKQCWREWVISLLWVLNCHHHYGVPLSGPEGCFWTREDTAIQLL